MWLEGKAGDLRATQRPIMSSQGGWANSAGCLVCMESCTNTSGTFPAKHSNESAEFFKTLFSKNVISICLYIKKNLSHSLVPLDIIHKIKFTSRPIFAQHRFNAWCLFVRTCLVLYNLDTPQGRRHPVTVGIYAIDGISYVILVVTCILVHWVNQWMSQSEERHSWSHKWSILAASYCPQH